VSIERYPLISRIAGFREGRGTDDGSRIFGFEGKVDKFEIRVIVFGSNVLEVFLSAKKYADEETFTSSISILMKASKAFSNSVGISR